MPVTFDNARSTANASTNLALTLTVGAGAVLIAFACGRDAPNGASAMAYGGVAMTRIGGASSTFETIDCFALTAPAAGSNVLSVHTTDAVRFGIIAVSYLNVKAVGPFGTVASATFEGTNAVFSISSTNIDVVVACFGGLNQQLTPGNGTLRASVSTTASGVPCIVVDITGAANTTLSANCSGITPWGMIGVPLRFSVASVAALRTMCLTGVGR